MTTLREAAIQALEALEAHADIGIKSDKAITALRAALAEPVQEPVAWALHTGTKQGIKWGRRVEHGTPLYTAPPQRKPEPVVNQQLTTEPVHEPFALPCPTPKACKAHCCSGHCAPRTSTQTT